MNLVIEEKIESPQHFPGSTCVECGRVMPAGTVQKCSQTVGGFCSWRIPWALGIWLDTLTTPAISVKAQGTVPSKEQVLACISKSVPKGTPDRRHADHMLKRVRQVLISQLRKEEMEILFAAVLEAHGK